MKAAWVRAALGAALAASAYLGAVGSGARRVPYDERVAASPHPPPPQPAEGAVRPPRRRPAEAAPLGTQLWTNGQPLHLGWLESPSGPAAEAARWARALSAEHGAVAQRRVARGWHLAARDARGDVVSVLVLARPHGGSLVVPAASHGPLRPGAEAARLGLPLLPGRRAVTSHASVDDGIERVAVQHLAGRPVGEVVAWYRQRLAERGYREAPPPRSERGGRLAAFRRGEAEVWLAVQETAEGTLVLLVREGRP